jgi:hypothetical protein
MNFKKNKLGQSALEFLILVMVVFVIFLGLIASVQYNIGQKNKDIYERELKEVGLNVQNEIELAHSSSDGYVRDFEILKLIGGKNYEINITEGVIYVRTEDLEFAVIFSIEDVVGDVVKGVNRIRREGGVVYLNS